MRTLLHSIPLFLLACSLGGQDFDVVQSSQPRDTSPNVTPAAQQTLATDGAGFAADLYGRVAVDDSSNVFFSPYSISVALAMTYNGAQGETAQQMASAMHFSLPVDQLNGAFDALDLALASRKTTAGEDGNQVKGFELNVADSLWADKTLAIAQPFVDTLGIDYGASLRLVDFVHAAEPARTTINGWVSDQTNSKIQDLIPPGDVDASTRLVLVNAIYFDAGWASAFDPNQTHAETFTHADGSTSQATMMSQTLEEATYRQGASWQAVELPYVGSQTSMVVVVPDAGQLASVEKSLSADAIHSMFEGPTTDATVHLSLPKFQIKGATISLKQQLEAMGMTDAFDSKIADFSKMASEPLHIGDVVHQAFVDVDEKGTEAAAATAVVMAGATIASKDVTLDVNRPFLFFIRDIPTNTVLFMGRVAAP
ncbi:MAG TPA: serpin family protein [Polyangiaceae bacterium]|jgi:serpin B